jgi:hypothetical protein
VPRFYFHVENGGRITDPHGQEFTTEAAARRHAERMAAGLGKNPLSDADWRVRVMDEMGTEIAVIQATEGRKRD